MAANSNWETFKLSVSFETSADDEARLVALKENVNALRSNVIELRAKKLFVSGINNVTSLENVRPSARQIAKTEEANAAARNEWAECTRHALENFATAQKTLDALSEAHGHASQLAADLASRRSELNAAAEQAAQLAASAAAASVARPDGGISPAEHAAAAANMEKLSGVRVAAGAGAAAGELCVELLGLETPATLVLRMDRVGGRSVLRGARLEPAGTAAVEDLVAFAVALDDPAFLVEETRGRIRCSAQRRAEVAALGRVHLVFDQGATVRVTFPSGVMVALETGPDYPLGVGGVRLSALETMGVAKIKFERVRDVVAACATLTEAVQVLTTELPQK